MNRETDGLRARALSVEDAPRHPVGFTDKAMASRGSRGARLISCPGSALLSWAETPPLPHQPFAAPGSTGNGVWPAPGGPTGSGQLTAQCARTHTQRHIHTWIQRCLLNDSPSKHCGHLPPTCLLLPSFCLSFFLKSFHPSLPSFPLCSIPFIHSSFLLSSSCVCVCSPSASTPPSTTTSPSGCQRAEPASQPTTSTSWFAQWAETWWSR